MSIFVRPIGVVSSSNELTDYSVDLMSVQAHTIRDDRVFLQLNSGIQIEWKFESPSKAADFYARFVAKTGGAQLL